MFRYEIGKINFEFTCSRQSRDKQDQVTHSLSKLYMMSKHYSLYWATSNNQVPETFPKAD